MPARAAELSEFTAGTPYGMRIHRSGRDTTGHASRTVVKTIGRPQDRIARPGVGGGTAVDS